MFLLLVQCTAALVANPLPLGFTARHFHHVMLDSDRAAFAAQVHFPELIGHESFLLF